MLKRTATTSYPPEIPLPLFGEVEIGGVLPSPATEVSSVKRGFT